MNGVLISICPKWCELIASGKKKIEVRKTRPKIKTPFKCYIYKTTNGCTNSVDKFENSLGMVIGEFVCDDTFPLWAGYAGNKGDDCLSFDEREDYLGGNGMGYGWHISDLVIYDKPKEVGRFLKADKCPYSTNDGCTYKYYCFRAGELHRCQKQLTRPPQSWCYVEEES